MLQTVDGKTVFVVDFDTLPTLPITYRTEEEKQYALILARAIQDGVITGPGKYGLEFEHKTLKDVRYTIHFIVE